MLLLSHWLVLFCVRVLLLLNSQIPGKRGCNTNWMGSDILITLALDIRHITYIYSTEHTCSKLQYKISKHLEAAIE